MFNLLIGGFHGTHTFFFLHQLTGGNRLLGVAVLVALGLWLLYRYNKRR
ncbi:hypothetical protein [Secundilactobacillus kimchicus]|nr:hypothetical protein [Secundilactobacillus kimchicus]MBT9671323.1 hypothetical protein [Secundilactobacillus kimchicus]